MPRLVWYMPGSSRSVVKVANMRVKTATRLQLQPILDARGEQHAAFLQEAYHGCAPDPARLTPSSMLPLFSALWALPWENARKEVFWRFTVDGLPTAARMHQGEGEPCNCGARVPGRAHHYWECPVAQAVCAEVQRGLQGYNGQALARHHIWLMQPTVGAIHAGVWHVVCLAAVLGMDKGRKLLTGWRLAVDAGGSQGRGSQDSSHPPALPDRIPTASRVAVATFWDYLADFVGLKLCPVTWLAELTEEHPFLHAVSQPAGGHALQLHRV